MKTLRLVLGDQLTRSVASLVDLDPDRDVVLMVEVAEEATYVRHHKQKIAFLFSAMRHFAQDLRREGIAVDYVRLDDDGNAGSFGAELARAVARHSPDRVVVTEPGEWRVLEMMRDWREELGVPVEIREDNRFLATKAEFAAWAGEKTFGDYQDAMKTGEPFLFHAVLSPYLNAGLLTAEEVCRAAEREWREGRAPLNAVEGFVRQIIGWREYVRGLYWLKMPAYAETNALEAARPLPDFYWTGETPMNCLAQCVCDTRRHAYAHHIQRLMVLGNFALIAGLSPAEVEEWYLVVFADAYEWVELPNVHGMILYADGGVLASKPYAASGAYIDRMSDYCAACAYDVKAKDGERACPFNYLYWNFLMENEARLSGNPRMGMPLRTLARMSDARRAAIREDSARFLAGLRSSYG